MQYTHFFKPLTLSLCAVALLSACGGDVKEWDTEQNLPVEGIESLNTEIKTGKLTLHGTDEATLKINTHFKLTSKRKGELAESIKLEAIPASNSIGMRLNQPALEQGESLSTDVEMYIPAGVDVVLSNTEGDISLKDLKSSVSIEGVNGNVTDNHHTGNLNVKLNNGNIALDDVTGNRHDLSTQNGTLELTAVTGALQAHSGNGNILAGLKGVNRPEDYAFSTTNGNVVLKLSGDASARVRYKKGVGNVTTDFKHLQDQSRIDVGEGAARIVIESTNGNVEVLKN